MFFFVWVLLFISFKKGTFISSELSDLSKDLADGRIYKNLLTEFFFEPR